MPIHTQKASIYLGRHYLRSHGFKTIVTKLVCIKLVINLRRSAPSEKRRDRYTPLAGIVYPVAKNNEKALKLKKKHLIMYKARGRIPAVTSSSAQ